MLTGDALSEDRGWLGRPHYTMVIESDLKVLVVDHLLELTHLFNQCLLPSRHA